jgi:DNA processing protein
MPSRCLEEPGPLSSVFGGGRPAYAEPEAEARALVLSALGPVAVHIDEIVRHTGLPVAQVRVVLLELDLAGRLHREAGGGVSLLPGKG